MTGIIERGHKTKTLKNYLARQKIFFFQNFFLLDDSSPSEKGKMSGHSGG